MFHGPAFQGVTELTAIGDRHVRGIITTPPAPGALLDNVGQILGYWIMATRTERTVVFPVGMREMRFYGPHPRPGTEVECLVRITSLTDTVLEADVQLTVDGVVWAELTGWQDRRFDNDPQTKPVERFPERNTLSEARPGGRTLLNERWPDLASRDLIMRNSLSIVERSQYAEHPPRGRRQWLLGRIAVKDAVRQWLWSQGAGPVFPAEIRVHNDESGRPYVTGLHGRTLPPLDVSLAHRAEAAVAIVRPHVPGPGPGIDIEEVVDRPRPRSPPRSARKNSPSCKPSWRPAASRRRCGSPASGRRRRRWPRRRAPASGAGRVTSPSSTWPPGHGCWCRGGWNAPTPCTTSRPAIPQSAGQDLRRGLDDGTRARGGVRPMTPTTEDTVLADLTGMLTTLLEDEYGVDDVEITMTTTFNRDLELESIDLVTLAGLLQEHYGTKVNFAEFLAGMEFDEIIELTVGRLVEYVVQSLKAAEAG